VKDNYSDSDMHDHAGTMALLGFFAFEQTRFSSKAARGLRGEPGKSNLAPSWLRASPRSAPPFVQTLNPYYPSRQSGRSSGGHGCPRSLRGLAAACMGIGYLRNRIRSPAAVNNLSDGGPPRGCPASPDTCLLSTTHDVGGPLARSLADLAASLDSTIRVG